MLEVEVDASVWSQQLQLRRPELLRALASFFGGDGPAIRDLRFRLGRSQGR